MATRAKSKSENRRVNAGVRVKRRSSIRARILRRVLPIVVIPTLILGFLTVAAIVFFETRTNEAVESAEEILTERVVEDAVNRSADRGAREIGEYVDSWIAAVEATNSRAEIRSIMSEGNRAVGELGINLTTPEADILELIGERSLLSTERINSLQIELTDGDIEPQVTLVARTGVELGSTLDDDIAYHGNARWFREAIEDGIHIRSFVDVPGAEPSFQISVASVSQAFTTSGVIRVQVPLRSLHSLIDDLVLDDAVDAVIIDKQSSALLADSSTDHAGNLLFTAGSLQGSGVNLELLSPGTHQDETNLSSARLVETSAGLTTFNWLIQTTQPIEVATEPLGVIREVGADLRDSRQLFVFVIGGMLAVALLLSLIGTRLLARRITEPIAQLSAQAQEAAEDGIPAVVDAAQSSEEELPTLSPFEVDTKDELSVLANSLNTMQDAAVDLAAGQAKLRRQNVARTFVSLGRRNQNLLNRQLEFIDELEGAESDPDTLENLFRLDHLATRMRRNAENLLVLAGEQTPRRWAKPVAVRDVLRAAASEIADYTRVRLGEIDRATVSGNLATDLSHLIAELLENAGSFSPPGSPIDILGQQTPTHYRLAIIDQGIGMDDAALAQANQRLANPVDFADAPSAYLGLFVVGHLARQLGITVRLAKSDPTGAGRASGTIAFIDLPVTLLSAEDATPISVPERSVEAASARNATVTPPPTPSAPNSAPEPARTATPETPSVVPVAETTAAGFPKRQSRATPASAQPAPVAETTILLPAAAAAAPQELTAAGFPKRRSAQSSVAATPDPAPAASTPPAAPPVPPTSPSTAAPRSPEAVSDSIRSFRDAVARGRADAASGATTASGGETPAPSDPPPLPPPPPLPAPPDHPTD